MFGEESEQNTLDPEELEVLKDAGILSSKSRKGKGRQAQHIVFVEDEEMGLCSISLELARNLILP